MSLANLFNMGEKKSPYVFFLTNTWSFIHFWFPFLSFLIFLFLHSNPSSLSLTVFLKMLDYFTIFSFKSLYCKELANERHHSARLTQLLKQALVQTQSLGISMNFCTVRTVILESWSFALDFTLSITFSCTYPTQRKNNPTSIQFMTV